MIGVNVHSNCQLLSAAERDNLLEQLAHEALTPEQQTDAGIPKAYQREAYQLEDGRVLYPLEGGALLWQDLETCVKIIQKEVQDFQQRTEVLQTIHEKGNAVLEEMHRYLSKLQDVLNIRPEELTGNLDSLKVLDDRLRECWPDKLEYGDLLLPLAAYVGLVLIQQPQVDGKWELRLNDFDQTPEPVVATQSGYVFQPLQIIDGALHMTPGRLEEQVASKSSLNEAVRRALERHQRRKSSQDSTGFPA